MKPEERWPHIADAAEAALILFRTAVEDDPDMFQTAPPRVVLARWLLLLGTPEERQAFSAGLRGEED